MQMRNCMNREELLFYDAYEEFYSMANESNAFQIFCRDAFGEDFSQDGFSNIEQIKRILQYIPTKDETHILDIGCGNGKMLGYLQQHTGAYIHGFDFSTEAINNARKTFLANADFQEGIIGEIEYKDNQFDVIISMDSMYFAQDMNKFVAQIKRWLKKDGVLFVGYQEGDIMSKTSNMHSTILAQALQQNQMSYQVDDITEETQNLLTVKRQKALEHKEKFEEEGNTEWYELLLLQTDCVNEPYEIFKEKMARYIYIVRNPESH